MILPNKLREKSFAIYGMGITGRSVVDCLKKNKVKYFTWDDNEIKKNSTKYKLKLSQFKKSLKYIDYIVVSPGINIEKSKIKKYLYTYRNKIISDIDLFYMCKIQNKSIVITGTNGKSTTCKIIEHLLKKNNYDVKLVGNIGQPILNIKIRKNTIIVIEVSSFQLAYSKFIKPDYAMILNISKDHLDWHKNMKNYINAKLKIFSNQDKKNFALLNNQILIKKFEIRKYRSKLKKVNKKYLNFLNSKIRNKYLNPKINSENIQYAYILSKILKIKNKSFIKACNSYIGLAHRYEEFYKIKNINFINDSKATSFESSSKALQDNKNIYWIVGGKPKKGDIFKFDKTMKNNIKAFIIGKNISFFKNNLKNKIDFKVVHSMKNAVINILKEIKKKIFINLQQFC